MTRKKKDKLNRNLTDHAVTLAKAGLGIIPFLGAPLAETLSATIPNQREDRVVKMLRLTMTEVEDLDERVQSIEEDRNLFENACIQASNGQSEERLKYISNMLKNGLLRKENSYQERSKLLSILNNLSDVEILMLKWIWFNDMLRTLQGDHSRIDKYLHIKKMKNNFDETHPDVSEYSKSQFFDGYVKTLEQSGLMEIEKKVEENMLANERTLYTITSLGEIFLEYIEAYEKY